MPWDFVVRGLGDIRVLDLGNPILANNGSYDYHMTLFGSLFWGYGYQNPLSGVEGLVLSRPCNSALRWKISALGVLQTWWVLKGHSGYVGVSAGARRVLLMII